MHTWIQKFHGSVPLKGEALVERVAFSMAAELNDVEITLEGDSLSVVNQITQMGSSSDWSIEGEVETMKAL